MKEESDKSRIKSVGRKLSGNYSYYNDLNPPRKIMGVYFIKIPIIQGIIYTPIK